MPGLTIERYYWCKSNEYFRHVTDKYVIEYQPDHSGRYGMHWTCTCKGYQFRGKCKHIEDAKRYWCGYGHEAAWGSPATDIQDGGKCPKCSGDVSVISVAV